MGEGNFPHINNMGLIDKEQIQSANTQGASVIAIPDDEKKKREEQEDPLFSDADLSLTNEAIRLVGLKQLLRVDATDTNYDKEIKGILEWAKESGIKNKNQLMSQLREIDLMLGSEDEKPRVQKLYEYLRIKRSIRGLVNRLEALKT